MNVATMKFGRRDLRAEVKALIVGDGLTPVAIARELRLDPADLMTWLDGFTPAVAVSENKIANFIDARRAIAKRLRIADIHTRVQFARILVRNVEILVDEMVRVRVELRSELCQQIRMQLSDLRRVLDLVGAGDPASAGRLIETLRSALQPGDRLLISRGAGEAPRGKKE